MSDESQQPGGTEDDLACAAKGSARPTAIEQRRRMVAESLQIGNLGNHARDLPAQADPTHDCQIELSVEDIRPYEHNPRRANNAKFSEIKASIRASGLRNPFTVTRRPGEAHFIVEAGGNTRLLALRQLWAETREARFHKITVLFRPWRSESHVLTAHLIENDQRGDMSFWDKATGMVALKAQLEAEKGRPLSLRQLDEELKAMGLSVNTTTLSQYLFATERLATLGAAVTDLTGLDVRTMQPRLNLMKRYAQLRASIAEAVLYAGIFEPVFSRHAEQYRQSNTFNVAALCQDCEAALAQHLGAPVKQVRMELDGLAQAAQMSLDAVAQGAPDGPGGQSGSEPAAANADPGAITVRTANTPANADRSASGRVAFTVLNPTHAEVLCRLTEQVRRFSTLAGISDCLRVNDAAPHGYVMAAPATMSASEAVAEPGQSLRQRAWWLLAAASGQLEQGALAMDDPETSRQAPVAESNAAQNALPAAPVLDAAFVGWLLDAQDEAAGAFWEVISSMRELRSTVTGHSNRAGNTSEGNP